MDETDKKAAGYTLSKNNARGVVDSWTDCDRVACP